MNEPKEWSPTPEELAKVIQYYGGPKILSNGVSIINENVRRIRMRDYPDPVPFSERGPEESDLDENGDCWWWNENADAWYYGDSSYCGGFPWTHWLPHWGLPKPVLATDGESNDVI
jgi:hypothetical protein